MKNAKPRSISKPTEVIAIGSSNLLVARGTPARVLKLLNGLAARPDINLRVVSTDKENPVNGSEHIRTEKGFFKITPRLIESIRERDADIIIGHTLGSIRFLFLLRFFSKARQLLEMHGFIAEEAFLSGDIGICRYKFNSLIHKFFFWSCDAVTTSSPTATKIVARYNDNVSTVFNGADINLFSCTVQQRYNFRSTSEDLVIGYAGNSSSYQGLDFLLENFTKISKKNPRYHLALLISGNYELLHKNKKIHLVKGVPHHEVPGFLASCDILVVPRPNNEVNRISFPSKLLEYMAMGKAVIASNTSDSHKVITTGVNGVLYSPGEEADFVRALNLVSDSEKRMKIGRKGRELIEQKYRNIHTQDRFYTLVKKLANQ